MIDYRQCIFAYLRLYTVQCITQSEFKKFKFITQFLVGYHEVINTQRLCPYWAHVAALCRNRIHESAMADMSSSDAFVSFVQLAAVTVCGSYPPPLHVHFGIDP